MGSVISCKDSVEKGVMHTMSAVVYFRFKKRRIE